jgi:hypothetical protein
MPLKSRPCRPEAIPIRKARSIGRAAIFLFMGVFALSCGRGGSNPGGPGAKVTAPAARAARTPASGATVSYIEGNAKLIRSGEESDLEQGDAVFESDGVKTGKKSSCELVFPGLGRVMVKADTRVEISKLDLVSRKAQITDTLGTVLAKVDKLTSKDAFMIRSRTVACGVRGTLFSVNVKKGAVKVAVLEGRVALYPDRLVASGAYEPGSPGADGAGPAAAEAGVSSAALDAFPSVSSGEEAICDSEAFAEAGKAIDKAIAASGNEGASDADIAGAAAALESETAPLGAAAKEDLESFSARPEAPEPPYLMSAGPSSRVSGGMVEDVEWPERGFWGRVQADLAAIPPVKADAARLWVDGGGAATASVVDGSHRFEVTKPLPEEPWRIQAAMPERRLEKGKSYRLRFVAWADAPHAAMFIVTEPGKDFDGDGNLYSSLNGYVEFIMGTSPERYTQIIHNDHPSVGGYQPVFQFGAGAGVVWLRGYALEELPEAASASIGKALSDSAPFPPNGSFGCAFLGWDCFSMEKRLEKFSIVDGAFRYSQDKPLEIPWHSQIFPQRALAVSKGKRYRLEFDSRAGGNSPDAPSGAFSVNLCEFGADFNGDGNKYTLVTPVMRAPFTPEWTHYRFEFAPDADLPRARLTIDLGETEGWSELDDISLVPVD